MAGALARLELVPALAWSWSKLRPRGREGKGGRLHSSSSYCVAASFVAHYTCLGIWHGWKSVLFTWGPEAERGASPMQSHTGTACTPALACLSASRAAAVEGAQGLISSPASSLALSSTVHTGEVDFGGILPSPTPHWPSLCYSEPVNLVLPLGLCLVVPCLDQ